MILHFAFINNSGSVKAQFMLPYKNAQFGLVMGLTRTPSFPPISGMVFGLCSIKVHQLDTT